MMGITVCRVILNAPDDCLLHISWLLSAITICGCLPDSFNVNTVVPIHKGHNVNISDYENYREIALRFILAYCLITLFCIDMVII